jgi:eukaryotic-like serine/threonine-protein kinase
MDSSVPNTPSSTVFRKFGRFELRQLLGKSVSTMTWLVTDSRDGRELMLTLPREQPLDASEVDRWMAGVNKAARLDHPQLASLSEVGVQDHWPFVAVDRSLGVTLGEWLAAHPACTPADCVELMIPALRGLAFAHDAGVAHLDVQPFTLLINDQGRVRWMALGVASPAARSATAGSARPSESGGGRSALSQLQDQRQDAQRDLLACGVLLHRWLAGQHALDEADVARVIHRLPPLGQEIVRLPWTTPHPVPDALRAIVNRSTASQERQRYHNTRTLLRALEGWSQAQALDAGGPLALLLDRLHSVGHLPAMPGLAGRVANMTSLEGQHADEMAEQVLQDMALSLELLRLVNSAHLRGSMLSGNGPVLAIRRSIALLGVDGVRRAANALRLWPGPLQTEGAAAMQGLINQVRLAGFAAQALRPAGYDPEVVYLIVILQNLGRLLVQYHFPEEAEQIQQLMQPAPPPPEAEPGTADLPGMTEEAAANAVLGVDLDTLRAAVVRHWGLGDEVLQMIRRLPEGKAVRTPDDDGEMLRTAASAGNELADAIKLKPPQRAAAAVAQVATRYARVLKITGRDVREALQGARSALRDGGPVAANTWTPDRTPASPAEEAAVTPVGAEAP